FSNAFTLPNKSSNSVTACARSFVCADADEKQKRASGKASVAISKREWVMSLPPVLLESGARLLLWFLPRRGILVDPARTRQNCFLPFQRSLRNAFCADQIPSIAFQQFDDVFHLHHRTNNSMRKDYRG